MTFRIEILLREEAIRIAFEGLLDGQAIEEIAAAVSEALRSGCRRVTLELGAGTEVEGEGLERLRAIEGLETTAVSPYLERWLRQCGVR